MKSPDTPQIPPVLAEKIRTSANLGSASPRRKVCLSYYGPVILQLIERRRQLRMSQADVEFRMGCAEGHVAKFESGVKFPSPYSLARWAAALNLKVEIVPDDHAA